MKHFLYAVLSVTILLFLSGCKSSAQSLTNYAQTQETINEKNGVVIVNNGKEKTYANTTNVQKQDINHNAAEDRARILTDEIEKNEFVERAAVVVTGNTAIVGLTLTEKFSDKNLIEIKREVEKTVKEADKEIDHVAVSSAPDLFERISNLSGGTNDRNEKRKLNIDKDNDAMFRLIPTV